MRFAIWAAVSTESQAAADKISLPDQVERCRQAALSKNWIEKSGPYIVPGESRTRWVNLRDAEQAIPALHQMLNDAQASKYDVLIIYDYNRFRDLLDPVAKSLSHYGVQIYSLAQPVEPVDPANYSPYSNDSSLMMQGLAKIISQVQNQDLRRKYRMAMPRRITDRGLPVQIPWGYSKPPGRETDRNAVPVQDPEKCALIVKAKDMLFAGQSLTQITEMFSASGYPPPGGGRQWYHQTIRAILRNPFYAGQLRFGVSQVKLDPRTGARFRDRSHPGRSITGAGKHQPLWDLATHQTIIRELARRGKNYKGRRNNQLTSLVKCGICGAPMWVFYRSNYKGQTLSRFRIWRCSSRLNHKVIKHDDLLKQVAEQLVKSIRSHLENPSPDEILFNMAENSAQRKRLEDAYQAGIMTLDSFASRISELDELERQHQDQITRDRDHQARLALLSELSDSISKLPDYLAAGNPQEVNQLLRTILERIIVGETVVLIYR